MAVVCWSELVVFSQPNRVALPPSMSFTTDSSIFPSLSLPLDPHAFTSSYSSLATPSISASASSALLVDGDEDELLGEVSVFDRKREQLRVSEFCVLRAKTAMVLQSSISHLEAKHDRDLGLIDILDDDVNTNAANDDDELAEDDQPGMLTNAGKQTATRGDDG